eukprot:gene562-2491_t
MSLRAGRGLATPPTPGPLPLDPTFVEPLGEEGATHQTPPPVRLRRTAPDFGVMRRPRRKLTDPPDVEPSKPTEPRDVEPSE